MDSTVRSNQPPRTSPGPSPAPPAVAKPPRRDVLPRASFPARPQARRRRRGPVHDRLRVDLHARVERDTQARRGGREPAELELGECDVAERERHPPFVPELAAQGAASAAELDGPLPVAGLTGGVAKVVQRDRAVPAIADPLGELGQLRVDRVLPARHRRGPRRSFRAPEARRPFLAHPPPRRTRRRPRRSVVPGRRCRRGARRSRRRTRAPGRAGPAAARPRAAGSRRATPAPRRSRPEARRRTKSVPPSAARA